jgi:hypothetical protein
MTNAAGRAQLAGVAAAVLTISTAVVGFSLHQFAACLLFGCALLPSAPLLLWPSWKGHAVVLAGVLTVAFVAAGLYVLYGHSGASSASSSSLATDAEQLAFAQIRAPIPYCAAFSGKGTIPPQDALLIFDEPADASGDPVAGAKLNYDGRAVPEQGGGWDISNILIGLPHSKGQYVLITALLVPSGAAGFLNSLPNVEYAPLPTAALGLGAVASTLAVVRSADATPCS